VHDKIRAESDLDLRELTDEIRGLMTGRPPSS
jgi:hypothetical protein